MKPSWVLLLVALCTTAEGGRSLRRASGANMKNMAQDRTITKVVKLLQKMLDDSKKEGDEERISYAKFKCYCDDNTAEKTAFEKAQADMNSAIEQMGQALDILAAIGADQTLAESAEHEQYMAGYKSASLLKLKKSVKEALVAANSFLTPAQRSKGEEFLQSPFTGTYSSHSGEIFGILKEMKETFTANLKSAIAAEKAAAEAHTKFMKTTEEEFDTLDKSYQDKQTTLSANDDSLADKKTALEQAEAQKADDEAFLEKLTPMCEAKAEEFDKRKMFRANEEAAISEAISILDNDKAFSTFGKVKATSEGATGFLLQLSAVRRHNQASSRGTAAFATRRLVVRLLQKAVTSQHSAKIARVLALLQAGNPFTKVLEAIESMKELIAKEAKVDKEQLDWCKSERDENNKNLDTKKGQITQLETAIAELDKTINDPETGLKVMIQQTEETLVQNSKSQADETKARQEETVEYQKTVGNTAEAEEMLRMAIAALEKYYTKIEELEEREITGFAQEDPAPPETWSDKYQGQSDQGNKVIKMLEFVLSETEKEETAAHDAEKAAQASYEDSLTQLKEEEEDLQKSLAKTQKDLADAEKDLVTKGEELEKTQTEKTAIEHYLEEIKPGCDFITNNYDTREKYRGEEEAALDKAVDLLKGSAAYAAAKAADKEESYGKCKETCVKDEAHADCKACLAGVSVPGYCAGHPGTPGC